MVSKASDDLPEPDNPVITVSELRGISRLMFFRLCWRAPRMTSFVSPMVYRKPLHRSPAHSRYTEARITFYNSRQSSQRSIFRNSNHPAGRIDLRRFLGGHRQKMAYKIYLTRKFSR